MSEHEFPCNFLMPADNANCSALSRIYSIELKFLIGFFTIAIIVGFYITNNIIFSIIIAIILFLLKIFYSIVMISIPHLTVRLHGNWVGGYAAVLDDAVSFRANKLNQMFQNAHAVSIPYETMRSVKPGRLFFVFETVDIETDHGLKRFRMFSKKRAQFTALVRPMVRGSTVQSRSTV